MYLVGLTGGIGSGKSTVSQMLGDIGIDVIDADLIARQVVRPGMKAWKLIRKHFGNEVILDSGEIDRKKLSEIIFADEDKRRLLNNITHPEIYKQIFKQLLIYLLLWRQFVVMDLPLLFESGAMVRYISKVIVVKCSRQQQVARLVNRNNYSESESISRIDAQMPLDKKCQMADLVIDNSGQLNETRSQVEEVVQLLRSSYQQWWLRTALLVVIAITSLIIVLMFRLFFYFLQ